MNTTLLKLALDSGLINYVDHETPRVYFICGHADIEEVEKFAELIVQECIVDFYRRYLDTTSDEDITSQVERYVQKHFGVEE